MLKCPEFYNPVNPEEGDKPSNDVRKAFDGPCGQVFRPK